MSLTVIIMLCVVALVVMLLLPPKSKSVGLAGGSILAQRSQRDIAIDEDLEAVGEAYRRSEREAQMKAAIAKVAALNKPAAS